MTQTHIILVRHGEAASSWSEHPDPGLSFDGITQAKNVSEGFTEEFSSYELLSSPKIRAIETMEPIAQKQKRDFAINHRFIEIPSADIPKKHMEVTYSYVDREIDEDYQNKQKVIETKIT